MKFARLTACAAVLACTAAAPAAAYVTPEQAQQAVDETVAWYGTQQDASGNVGFFGGDWSMIALANAGKSAADLRLSPTDPSLQDYFAGDWAFASPFDVSTDQSRKVLSGRAGGLQTARLNESQNIVANQMTFFDGRQMGSASQVNDDMFALLALEREGSAAAIAPALVEEVRAGQDGGGWNYGGGGEPDPDVTGAGVAALCAGGVPADDPAVAEALAYMKTKQDDATGGFASDFFGVNADTTAWAVNGLRECGIDPQGPEWTTSAGKTPLDFLLSLQKSNGSFRWQASETDADPDNLYATQDAVTGLVGEGFGTEPAERDDPAQPRFRPAPEVAGGTTVPLTLVIDHGSAQPGAERACKVEAPLGASVAEVLETGVTTPPYCAASPQMQEGRLESVNGVGSPGGTAWQASVDGGAASEQLSAPVALGSVVSLALVGSPSQPAPQLPPLDTPDRVAPLPRVVLSIPGRRALRLRGGRVRVTVSCPRGLEQAGCVGVLHVLWRRRGELRTGGVASFAVRAGAERVVAVRLFRGLRRAVRRNERGRAVRLRAATRDPMTLAKSVTRTRARVRP
jgi:hypothetical protein